jgi:hypothetical protein
MKPLEHSLFSFLSKYRIGLHKSPMEDLFSQVFAWICARYPELLVRLIKDLCNLELSLQSLTIETQKTYGAARIDVQVGDNRHLIFIENKLTAAVAQFSGPPGSSGNPSKQGTNQITEYRHIAENQAALSGRTGHVMLLTQYEFTRVGMSAEFSCSWNEVFHRLTSYRDTLGSSGQFLLNQFLKFMEDLGMVFTGLNAQDLPAALTIARIYGNLTILIERAIVTANEKVKRWQDWDNYRACYFGAPDRCWLGIGYLGEAFGRVLMAFDPRSDQGRRRLVANGFAESEPGWGPEWKFKTLAFEEYAQASPELQAKRVCEFVTPAVREFRVVVPHA